jgi:AcrR family transcriptional regulator
VPRTKLIPDSDIHAALLSLLRNEGEKAITFSALSRATGLAPATLVQRFGSLDGMMVSALIAGWQQAEAELESAEEVELGPKGALPFLKSLPDVTVLLAPSLRNPDLRDQAFAWRQRAEAGLALRLEQDRAAPLVFALWAGQAQWKDIGPKGFKWKEALKSIT